jgi:predicted house-cleaning NTP pyrophosphatase (Maf/HAM1 superfamily)
LIISGIRGSYENVMGLPVGMLMEVLQEFCPVKLSMRG